MKKIAVFKAEFESEDMISQEELEEYWDNDWLKFMKEIYEDEGIGIFDEIELVEILGGTDETN